MTSRPSTNMYSKGFSSGFVTDVNVVEVTSCRQRQPVKVCAEGPSGPRTVRRPRHHQSKINYEELVQSCHIKIIAMANHIMMNYDQGHHTTTSNPKVRPFQSCYIYICVCVCVTDGGPQGLAQGPSPSSCFCPLIIARGCMQFDYAFDWLPTNRRPAEIETSLGRMIMSILSKLVKCPKN